MQELRASFAVSLGAAFGSSLGVAYGVSAGAGVAGLFVGALLGALLGGALAWALVPPPSRGPSPSLALVVIARDEEAGLPLAVASVRDYVDEIVIAVDARTKDRTREVVPGATVIDVEFRDFAQMRAEAVKAARSSWILMLDADETLEGDPRPLLGDRVIWQMPRRHWADLGRTVPAAADKGYPDRQTRLFPNDPAIRFERPVHELVTGLRVRTAAYPVIHHFKQALRSPDTIADRERLYAELLSRARSQSAQNAT